MKTLIENYINGNITEAKKQAKRHKQSAIPAPASPVPLPAFRVHMDDGTSYLTSMAHGVTLETARRYFIGMRQVREDMRTGEERTSIVINVEVAQ